MAGAAGIVERWRTGAAALARATSPPPRPSRWAWTADAILALVLAACTAGTALRQGDGPLPLLWFPRGVPLPPPLPGVVAQHAFALQPGQLVLATLSALPLAVRRYRPLAAFWLVLVATLLFHRGTGADDTAAYTFLSCVIAAYSAAVYSPYRAFAVTSLVAGAGLVALSHDTNFPDVPPAFFPFLLLLAIGLAANTIHTWKQRVRALEERQQAVTRLAVDRERARIARELHDVVTHNVSVMVIQAGAARKVMDTAPDRAREALLAVEAGGRTAMAELRHVMGLLTMTGDATGPSDAADLAPQPGLGRLTALTDRVRDTGVPVEVTVTGTPAPLPAGPDLAAYRVVQEALTNAVRHAAGSRVRIALDYAPGTVTVEVTDTGGASTAPADAGSGRGLVGLRERLAVYGGTLRAEPRPTGGFRVHAVIPIEEPS